MKVVKSFVVQKTSGDSGLIADQHDAEPEAAQLPDRGGSSGDRGELPASGSLC